MADLVESVWTCEGCGEEGPVDYEELYLGLLHHCPTIKGPFGLIPKLLIEEKR